MSRAAGRRNRLVAIRELDPNYVNAANQQLPVYRFVMERWAEFRSPSGMAYVRSSLDGAEAGPHMVSWRINYTPGGIDNGMVVDYKQKLYTIKKIIHDEDAREHTDLVCEIGATNDG